MTVMKAKDANLLQTLRRGMDAVSLIAQAPEGLSIAEIAARLGVNRAIAYRIVATLDSDGFVTRGDGGRIFLGGAVLALAAGIEPQLRVLIGPELARLAEAAGATAFLSVARGADAEAVLVAESTAGLIRVGYRVGSRHPLLRGAAGIAILAGRPAAPGEAAAVAEARRAGFSITRGELQRGAVGIAAPLRLGPGDGFEASVGVVALDDLDAARVAPLVVAAAAAIAGVHSPS